MAPETDNVATFNIQLGAPTADLLEDGFDEFGIRKNQREDGSLESIDVRFRAMEPGIRKEIEVDGDFLSGVAAGFSEPLPAMLDHDHDQLSQVGWVNRVLYTDALGLEVNIPNTGSSVKSDVISDFTHDVPQIQHGSVGFDPATIEFAESEDESALARFASADLIEFSFTPFPAGYDEGGLSPAFSEAVDLFVSEQATSGDVGGENADAEVASQLLGTNNESQLI